MDWRRFLGGKPQVVLAEKPKRRVMRNEVGAGGVVYMGGNAYSDETNAKLIGREAVETYDKMRRTDAQVAALVNTCRLPLLSANWTIERPPEDEQAAKVTDEHLFFARDNLFRRVNFPQFLEHALSCVWAGYAIAEIVWGVENGQVVLRKLAPRLATTIDKWSTDGSGNLLSVDQYVYKDDRYQYVTLPREKIALFTYAQEANNYQGMSILRAVNKHWALKDTIYRLDAIRCERYAVGVPKITLPEEFDDDLYDMAESIGKNWKGASQSYVVLPAGMDIEIVTMEGGEALNLMDTIKHHNEEIAKVGLAQFINMGQTETGSRALGDVSTSFFYDAEKGWARNIAATINRDVLWPLMDMNFPGEVRPTVVASDIGFVALEELINAIKDVGPDYLPPALDIENAVRSRLSLPRKDAEDYVEPVIQSDTEPAEEGEYENDTEDLDEDETEQRLAAIAKRIHDAVLTEPAEVQAPEESDFWRPLRESERMVNLRQMAGLLDDTQDRLYRIMVAGRDAWLTVLKEQIPDAIQQGPATIMALSIPDEQTKPVLAQMRPVLAEVYKYGADQTKREINSQSTSLRTEQMEDDEENELLMALLLLAVGRLAEKTTEAVQTTALGQFRTIGGAAYTQADLETLMAQVTDTVEQDARLGAALAVSETLNLGRDAAAASLAQKVAICEYSAIMDDGTCENCRQADGTRVAFQSKEYYDLTPPLKSKAFGTCQGRHRCRCIWIYLTKVP